MKPKITKIFQAVIVSVIILLFHPYTAKAQEGYTDDDAFVMKKIFQTSLTDPSAYNWLEHLTGPMVGHRLAGSAQSLKAVEYTKSMMDTMHLSRVWLQECMVPSWDRGDKEIVKITKSKSHKSIDLRALALGFSGASPSKGVKAEVIEVQGLAELEKLGPEAVKGKIVFFNRPFDAGEIRTFTGYGGAVDQRGSGPNLASKMGAVAALVRSMTPNIDEWPHTGATHFPEGTTLIPAIAIATMDAEILSALLKKEIVEVFIKVNCKQLPDAKSYNVIGEIKGSEKPEEVILIGGHLDSWDVGAGAHDDGSGCVQSLQVLNLIHKMNYKPKRTIRCVLFMNEESGLAGGKAYGEYAKTSTEIPYAALESDEGGFTPRGITCEGDGKTFLERFKKVSQWNDLFEPYDLRITKGGSGADISTLKPLGTFMMGLRPDSARYFDFHHTNQDIIKYVNPRELAMGAATMTTMIYLIDKYGL